MVELEWASACRSTGGAVCGDVGVVAGGPKGTVAAVVDGLGRGREAARAAERAAGVVRTNGHLDARTLVGRCHEELRQTRGAAIGIARFAPHEERMAWIGVGGVAGALVNRAPSARRAVEAMPRVSGLAGHHIPPLEPATVRLLRGDVLVLASDGVSPAFADSLDLFGTPAAIAERILDAHWNATDDALVIVAAYLGNGR